MTRALVDKALTLVIPLGATRDMNHSDNINLMETYGVLEIAKNDFLNGNITFEEYITLLEKGEVIIDDYLETVEHNLIELNLI